MIICYSASTLDFKSSGLGGKKKNKLKRTYVMAQLSSLCMLDNRLILALTKIQVFAYASMKLCRGDIHLIMGNMRIYKN